MRSTTRKALPLAIIGLLVGAAGTAFAANSTVPGAITSYSTIQCAGFEWRITGDDNANCAVAVEYRRQGDAAWKPAQPLWRVETGLWHHGEDPGDLLAGSIFFLDPATTYDVRLTLNDPDGGSSQQIVSVTTHAEPVANANARVRYIAPGSGGGSGTVADPFRGFAAADAAAQPGDLFIVQAGTYSAMFTPTRNGDATHPIVYRGASASSVILDGGGGTSGGSHCVNLDNRQYVFIENMTLQNCLRPVSVYSTVGVSIRGCTIQPIHQATAIIGIVGDTVHDLFIGDNTILMPGDWAGVGRTGTYGTGGYGVHVTGDGIVICYNKVVESWDGLDAGESDGTVPRTWNVDIYNNLVDRASDDATQTDAVHQNIRIFRNRFINSASAVSAQPAFGGPCYFMFNEMYNTRSDPFKYHQETFYYGTTDPQETIGMLAFHNTNICSKSGWYEGGYWHHVKNRNNLLLGARANLYSLYIPSGQRGDLDYDGYNRQQSNLVKYNGTAYANLAAFYAGAGQEQHGIEITIDEFVRAAYPAHPEWEPSNGYGAAYAPSDVDLQLKPTSLSIDKGQVLANINDGYVGSAPDLGCYERGKPVPWYGPRQSGGSDVTAPAAIADLAATLVAPDHADLAWSASGDDGSSGQATSYEIRMSSQPITAQNFDGATLIPNSLTPRPAGQSEQFMLVGLTPGSTLYVAIKAVDEASNRSAISNVLTITTPTTDTIPPAKIQDLSAGP
jgi:hypothetical protein